MTELVVKRPSNATHTTSYKSISKPAPAFAQCDGAQLGYRLRAPRNSAENRSICRFSYTTAMRAVADLHLAKVMQSVTPLEEMAALRHRINPANMLHMRPKEDEDSKLTVDPLTLFGLFAVTAMLVFYALEDRNPWFILAFAGSCLLGSAYGFLQGAWPFGLIEAIWAGIAAQRWWRKSD